MQGLVRLGFSFDLLGLALFYRHSGRESQDVLTKPAVSQGKSRFPYQAGHLVRKINIIFPNRLSGKENDISSPDRPSGKENQDLLTKPAIR